jgi:zinc protease
VGVAGQLSTFQTAGLPVSYVEKRNDLINAVTIDDVRRVAKRLFNAGRLTIVIAGSPDAPKQPVRPLPGADKPPQPARPVAKTGKTLPPRSSKVSKPAGVVPAKTAPHP